MFATSIKIFLIGKKCAWSLDLYEWKVKLEPCILDPFDFRSSEATLVNDWLSKRALISWFNFDLSRKHFYTGSDYPLIQAYIRALSQTRSKWLVVVSWHKNWRYSMQEYWVIICQSFWLQAQSLICQTFWLQAHSLIFILTASSESNLSIILTARSEPNSSIILTASSESENLG